MRRLQEYTLGRLVLCLLQMQLQDGNEKQTNLAFLPTIKAPATHTPQILLKTRCHRR